MADKTSRSYRTRDSLPRESNAAGWDASDPLAELARLIGQSDPNGGFRNGTQPGEAYDAGPAASELDWAAGESYGEANEPAHDRYAPPGSAEAYHSYPAPSDSPQSPSDRGYAEEEPPSIQYSSPAPFGDAQDYARGDAGAHDTHGHDGQALTLPRAQPLFPPSHDGHSAAPHDGHAQSYDTDEYEESGTSGRRSIGTVVILAVLGLAVVGTAGAFAYRTMFGGLRFPSLPPIIKATDRPNKIVASRADPQAAPTTGSTSGDQLVPHQEQPVDIPTPPQGPRVVATIPVLGNSSAPSSAPPPPAPAAPQPPPSMSAAPASSAAVAAPPATGGAPVAGQDQPPPAGAVVQPPGARRVHTVVIRPDAPGGATAPPSAHTARQHSSDAPMAIVPSQTDAAPPAPPPPRSATSHASASAAVPTTASAAEAAPAAAGGYAVQVSSQRSEAEAHAAFRSLRSRFPQQLGGREPMIRRADLGAKGVFYRALVGPFGSAEQAAGFCSSLKAAGGSCIVQRN